MTPIQKETLLKAELEWTSDRLMKLENLLRSILEETTDGDVMPPDDDKAYFINPVNARRLEDFLAWTDVIINEWDGAAYE
jgi:hypothetical protein